MKIKENNTVTNKRFLTKGAILVSLLVFLFAMAAIGVLGAQPAVQAYVNQNDNGLFYSEDIVFEQSSSMCVRTIEDDELTIDDIRSVLSSGGQIDMKSGKIYYIDTFEICLYRRE